MEALLTSWWGLLVILAGALTIVVGLGKNIRSVKQWLEETAKAKVDHDEMEARIMEAVKELDKTMRERDDKLFEKISQLNLAMDDVSEQTSSLSYDRLMWAYSKYCVRHSPIGVAELASMERIYEAYAKNGRNHVPNDFMKRLKECPVETV